MKRLFRHLCALCCGALLGAWAPAQAADAADRAAQQAREAARADRHADAIAAFGRAVQAAPHRRPEWLQEWADQHTWAGQLDEAIALYREAGATQDPVAQYRARLGMARALSWAGRQSLALAQYEALLRDLPLDAEARRGVGRVQSWRGRHREAAALMQEYLQDHPHDREATVILAESLSWMGRADRAQSVLRAQLAADADDARAAKLLKQLENDSRQQTTFDWREFDQSDRLRIRDLSLATQHPVALGRGHVGLHLRTTRFVPTAGTVSRIDVVRPSAQARWRLNDDLEWNGRAGLDLIDTTGSTGDHSRLVHDTYLTWWPSDLLRLDLGSSRWTFDSEETLRKGLTATQIKLSADLLPDELTRWTVRVHSSRLSDSNRGDGWQFEAERRVRDVPRVHVGYRHNRYGFSLPGQSGYFNPADYRSDELTLQASGRLPTGLRWQLGWATGLEKSRPGDERPIRSANARLTWEVSTQLAIEAAYDHSTSRTLSDGGFSRGIARLTLQYRH
ncbi:tetratricopeptide repeat protein [Hydrogenophaga sp.]|uniref:tetratricopeptide repeat protein n=1 Tax=Hydrogenophaga sp. TaxID=1904254 RepID=UPI0026201802|nr:tetratricopeptide repeat protein [Hydrogenophaga sp.]MDM7948407.1 tetratricopeptide repeat protein [Hydrogenophaga sp.]